MIPGINTGAGYATITKIDSLSNITLNRDYIEACIKDTGNSDNDIIFEVVQYAIALGGVKCS